jgi:hypothetical protein
MPRNNLEGKLESVRGPLAFTLTDKEHRIDIQTWQSAAQLTKEMIKNVQLRNFWHWTSDSSLAHLAGNDVEYILGELDTNLIARNVAEATRQLKDNQNYFPSKPEVDFVLASKNTLRVKASELGDSLQRLDGEWSYIEVSTEKLAEGRAAFRKEYGATITAIFDTARGKSMYGEKGLGTELQKAGKNATRVYFLNPDYVRTHLKDKKGGAIARACSLNILDYHSNFNASDRNVGYQNSCVRGVPINAAEGGALQAPADDNYTAAYKTLITTPEKLTPEIVAGLRKLIEDYRPPK